jgi:predicted P-loop ATPase
MEEHTRAETERKRHLFAWADGVLHELGLAERIAHAGSLEELRKITFDADAAEIALAIREALHPAGGAKDDCFAGLREGGLKRILKMRFDEMKREREGQLRCQQGGKQSVNTDWTDELKLDEKGAVRPILSNLILFLIHHPKWKGVLAYDEFSARVVIRKRPPWRAEVPDAQWTDHHESLTRVWFQREDILKAGQGDVGRAVQAAARANPIHPVREYLAALAWDGKPRIETWLIDYMDAEDTPYVRAIGPRWLISAVARIYQPGCQVDHTLVLEGPQGKLKSTTLSALAGEAWFTDRLSHVASKDCAMEIAGVWLVEISEMDAVTRAGTTVMKAFLTRRFDRFRPPWARHLVRQPRQSVFAGTVNPPPGGYLKDATGARRFWPFACRRMIDRDGVMHDRDQLWAEAVARYKAGEKWWLETPELEALATAEQEARFKSDVWKPKIKEWLGGRTDVSLTEVLRGALEIKAPDHAAEIRVAKILASLGFRQYRPRRGQRSRRYRRH